MPHPPPLISTLREGRDADWRPITKGGRGPFEYLSLGPRGCPEAMAPKSQSAVYNAGREVSQLTDESTKVREGR